MSRRQLPASKLPRLKQDREVWIGSAPLTTWTGFQPRQGPYGSRSRPMKRPLARFSFQSRQTGDGRLPRPSEEQRAAYTYLVDHESAVTRAILARVFRAYPKLRAQYHKDYDIDPDAKPVYADKWDELFDDLKPLPALKRPRDLRRVMGLAWVHVLDVAKAGVAYVGFELGVVGTTSTVRAS